MPFRFLEHVSDILIEATGKDFNEALESAGTALSAAAAENVIKEEEFEFEESAANIEELVVAVLQRLLVESEIRTLLPGGLKVKDLHEERERVTATIIGWAGRGTAKTIIKGVTYGMLKVERNETCRIQVLFDI
jgi:SHS2 domain-containing protein